MSWNRFNFIQTRTQVIKFIPCLCNLFHDFFSSLFSLMFYAFSTIFFSWILFLYPFAWWIRAKMEYWCKRHGIIHQTHTHSFFSFFRHSFQRSFIWFTCTVQYPATCCCWWWCCFVSFIHSFHGMNCGLETDRVLLVCTRVFVCMCSISMKDYKCVVG